MRWMLVAATLAWMAPRASAQATSAHVTLSGNVAATDNALSTQVDRQADVFYQLRPGLLLTYDGPRMMHQLTIDADILQYVRHSTAPSLNERASWMGVFLVSPLSEIVTTADIGTGQLNALTTGTSADQAAINIVPSGAIDVRSVNASEYGSRTLSDGWRVSETIGAHYTGTYDTQSTRTHSGEASGGVAVEYGWRDNSVGLEASVEYLSLERYAPQLPPGIEGSRDDKQLNPHAIASWRHDFNRYWSGSLQGGVEYLHPIGTDKYNPGDTQQTGVFPLLGASLNYTDIWGRVTISGSRTLSPNLYIAQNTQTTDALVQLLLPLPWLDESRRREPKLIALGTVGFTHTSLINTDATVMVDDVSFDNFHADVALAYNYRPGMTFGLRYEFLYQTGSTSLLQVIQPYSRNTVFLTFSVRWPDRTAVTIPKRQNSVRADHKDLPPIGEEVVVPDDPNEADR